MPLQELAHNTLRRIEFKTWVILEWETIRHRPYTIECFEDLYAFFRDEATAIQPKDAKDRRDFTTCATRTIAEQFGYCKAHREDVGFRLHVHTRILDVIEKGPQDLSTQQIQNLYHLRDEFEGTWLESPLRDRSEDSPDSTKPRASLPPVAERQGPGHYPEAIIMSSIPCFYCTWNLDNDADVARSERAPQTS